MTLPSTVDHVCRNCAITAESQPYQVDTIRCPHTRLIAHWLGSSWSYHALTQAGSRRPKPKPSNAGKAHLMSLFRRPGAL